MIIKANDAATKLTVGKIKSFMIQSAENTAVGALTTY
jgi:hypothetical protein